MMPWGARPGRGDPLRPVGQRVVDPAALVSLVPRLADRAVRCERGAAACRRGFGALCADVLGHRQLNAAIHRIALTLASNNPLHAAS